MKGLDVRNRHVWMCTFLSVIVLLLVMMDHILNVPAEVQIDIEM